ncbi:MAG TPA: phage tail tape measure protein [Prolixibacteraceae bacterium]|jgi:TP901 family phage tail tape measure protein|nr:phage tail tape measure protein [Prolixibacteraceae bacterium]
MNKKIYNEDLTLNLILNGDKLQKGSKESLSALYKLDQETRKLQLKVQEYELDKRRLNKTEADYANKLDAINSKIRTLNAQIQSNYQAMMQMRKEIGLAGMTVNQLNSHLKVLKTMLMNATDPGIIKRLRREIEQTNVRITTITTGAGRLSQAWSRMAREANKYSAAIGWISIITYAIGNLIGKIAERAGFLDRKISGVMKTSGLLREEAYKLRRDFDQMVTPTSSDDLMDIARIAGMLGIKGFADIEKFTGAVDILQIALGEDLNTTVEETATKVGKLVNAFRVTDKMPIDEALLRTGSLLNELDKASVASAGTILEYMTRLSSLGTSANYPIEAIAGLGATLESVNIPAERGSTALRNIIGGLGKYSDKFSRILGVTTDEYKRMVETDINGTFIKLIELTAKGDKSIIDVVKSMGDFEVSGVRVAEVYSALAKNIDVLKVQQDIAKRAFASSDSVMGEFLITLEDYQAAIDLQKKRVNALGTEYNLALKSSIYNVYKLWVDLLYMLRDLTKWIILHGRQIGALIPLYAAWKSNSIAIWITGVWKANVLLVKGLWDSVKATIANNIVLVAWQRHGIKGAIVALRQLWATMAVNPMALFIAIIGVAAAAFMFFTAKTDKMKEAMDEMSADMVKMLGGLNGLFEELKKSGEGTEKRAQLIKTINEQYGTYLPKMLTEADNLNAIEAAQLKANEALSNSIALKYKNSAFDEIAAEDTKKRQQAIALLTDKIEKKSGSQAAGAATAQMDAYQSKVLSGSISGERSDIYAYMDKFISDWGINDYMGQSTRMVVDLLQDQLKKKKKLDEFMAGYLQTPSTLGGESSGGPLDQPKARMSEDEFKAAMKNAEIKNTIRKTALNNRKMTDDKFKIAELDSEKEFILEKIDIQKRYGDSDGTKGDLEGLQLQLAENAKARRDAGLKEVKEQDKIEKKLFDMDKLRIESMAEGRDKDLAEEMNRSADLIAEYEKSGMDRSKIDEAIELESKNHMNKMYDINLKYIDKELDNNTMSFAERMTFLEFQYTEGEIKEQEYLDRKKALQDEYQKALVQWNRKAGDIDIEAMDAEIALAKTRGIQLGMTEAQIQENIMAIRKKYYAKMDKNAETHAQKELRMLKEQFTQEQMDAFAQGEFVVGLAQQIGQGVGSAIGLLFDDTQKTNEAILKTLIETVLDAAHAAIMAWEAVILAREIATKGAVGIPTAAIYMGLIEVAYGAAKAVLGTWNTSNSSTSSGSSGQPSYTKQAAKGIYPVVGADDGRTYNARFIPRAGTGIYGEPTLIAERPEMVIDYPTLRNMQMNAPGMIQSIMAMRVPQYAGGRYPGKEGKDFKAFKDSKEFNGGSYQGMTVQDVRNLRLAIEAFMEYRPPVVFKDFDDGYSNYKKVTGGGIKTGK